MFGKWLVPVLGGCVILASLNWLVAPEPPPPGLPLSALQQGPVSAMSMADADRAVDLFVACLQTLATADLIDLQPVPPAAGLPLVERVLIYRQSCPSGVLDVHWASTTREYGRRTVAALLASVDVQMQDADRFLALDAGGRDLAVTDDVVWRAAFDRAAADVARFHLELLEFYAVLEGGDAP